MTLVRILACLCVEISDRRIKPGVHDGMAGEVVGSDPAGHVYVRFAPLAISCRAGEVEMVDEVAPMPPDGETTR